jgi:hypothetical protein
MYNLENDLSNVDHYYKTLSISFFSWRTDQNYSVVLVEKSDGEGSPLMGFIHYSV